MGDPDEELTNLSLKFLAKSYSCTSHHTCEVYVAHVEFLRRQFTSKDVSLPAIKNGLNCAQPHHDKLIRAFYLMNQFQQETTNYWVRYPTMYMEKVIESMLGLLSVPAFHGRLTPLHFIAIVDPRAKWFNKWMGIPIIYYGTEQDFHGGNDPHNRESLWPCYNQTSSTYLFVKGMLAMRHRLAVYFPLNNQVELYADDHLMVFTRGALSQILVAITNVGQNANITRTLTNLPFKDKTTFINVDHANDTLVVQNASFTISLQHGYPKVYVLEFAVNTTQSDTSSRGNRSHDVITICALWAWAVANVVTFVGSLLVH